MSTDELDLKHIAEGQPADAGDFLLQRRARLVTPHLPRGAGSLLDFGCGNGAQTALFASHFEAITGLDVNPDFLDQFRTRFRDLPCEATGVAYDGREIPLETASFDCVTSFEVLEHVDDEALALAELHRVLVPGGTLVMSVPNRWWIFETHGAELPLLPWNRVPFFSWLPKRIHDRWAHARIYRRREFLGLLRDHGFEVLESAYVTAPMDVVKVRSLQKLLRASLFRGDTTALPFMATAVLAVARKPAPA